MDQADLGPLTVSRLALGAMLMGDTTPAPGPEFEFRSRDVAVAVGTVEGLATLRDVMRH